MHGLSRFAANKAAMKLAEKAARQADTAKRRSEVQQKFGAMTEEEREAWRSARQAKRQNRKSEMEDKRSRLQQVCRPYVRLDVLLQDVLLAFYGLCLLLKLLVTHWCSNHPPLKQNRVKILLQYQQP